MPASISQLLETNINCAISKRKITHTGGLPEEVILMTDEQYDFISNIDVDDGLINGSQCVIKYIQTTTKMTQLTHTLYGFNSKTKKLAQITIRNIHTCMHKTQTEIGHL